MGDTRSKDWLEGHTTESSTELIGKLETHEASSVFLAFEQAIERKFHRGGRSALSQVEYHLLAICALDREVQNGGYLQFFENSSRIFAEDIVEALEAAGAKQHAQITKDAIAAFNLQCSPNEEVLDSVLQIDNNWREDCLNEYDSKYYGLGFEVCDFALAYLSENISEVVFTIMGKSKMERAKIRAEQVMRGNRR